MAQPSIALDSGSSAQTERWVLVATILASSMAFIDSTALNVALPAIQTSLGATGSEVFWVISAYNLFLAALILVGGSLGDILGLKRVFTAGMILFTLASAACALAPTPTLLIIARAVQGTGGALMVPSSLALLSAAFPRERRGIAIGTWSTFTTVTSVLGPVIGGWLAGIGLWRGVFLINLPLAIAALLALSRASGYQDERAPGRLDIPGALLATLGLGGVTYGFIQGPESGFDSPVIIGALALGVVALIAFLIVEARSPHPMVSLRLFRSRTFSGANALTFFLYGALAVFGLFVTLNLVQAQGYLEAEAGLALLPFSIMLILLSRWAGGLSSRVGPRLLLTAGPAITGVGFLLFALMGMTGGPRDYWTTVFPAALVVGIGMGLTVAPLTTTVMTAVPAHSTGSASGINNAVARTAGVLAISVLGALAIVLFTNTLAASTEQVNMSAENRQTLLAEEAPRLGAAAAPEGVSDDARAEISGMVKTAFVDTYRVVMLICAGLAWLSALLAFMLVEPKLLEPEAGPAPATG